MAERPEDDDYDAMYETEVMQGSVDALASSIIGQQIVTVERRKAEPGEDGYVPYGLSEETVFTLANGHQVILGDTDDCCAFTEVSSFDFLEKSDNVITRVEVDEGFETWFIYADQVPVVHLGVSWSPGNPYYYGFGFSIRVKEPATND